MGKFFKNKKTGFGVLAFLALMLSIVLSCLLPENRMPIRAIGVLTSCFVLWISEAMPISVSTLLMIALLPVLGLMDFETILSSMGINSALFIMASSGMTIALCNSAIPKALTNAVLKKTYRHPTILIASVAILVSLFSAFVSSLATCVLFTGLISGMLHEAGIRPKESRMGKNLLIIIPACSGIGGFMTPAGTPANILVIDLLKTKGIEISFLKWCAIGFPLGILATILFTLSVILIFKPSKETKYEVPINRICFSKDDKNVLCIVVLTIIGWIVSGFIPGVNITMVALIGVALFFLPPIHVKQTNRRQKE